MQVRHPAKSYFRAVYPTCFSDKITLFWTIIMKTDSDNKQVLTIHEVADYLRVTEKTVYRLLAKKDIPAFKIGGSWRFERATLDLWIKQKSKACA